MRKLGKVLLVVALLILHMLFSGYVFMKVWEWFISSTFEVAPLTLMQAIGVSFVITMFKASLKQKEELKEDFSNLYPLIWDAYLGTTIAFVLGGILSMFM